MQLVVIITALARGRPSLAVGNIVGSAISNILGAFSLGLVFRETGDPAEFDRSSQTYSLVLLIVTTFVAPITYFSSRTIWRVYGVILLALFAVYVFSIGWAISKGSLTAPVDLDDSSSDDGSDGESVSTLISREGYEALESGSQVPERGGSTPAPSPQRDYRGQRSLTYHIFYLVLGFAAISLAGYVLSHAATNITDAIGMSDVLFGVIILAIATTLPEKFVAVMSGFRGHMGILVANTVGSNIFLLSLCMGIIMVDASEEFNDGNVNIYELAVLWGSTLAFTLTVWVGGGFGLWIGVAMLAGYIAFVVLEFTVIYNVTDSA
jgi:Ca2+/Na+ antiporter